jgi:hypothetical protein
MTSPTSTRRSFIATSGGAIAGSLAFTSGAIALLAPARSWALQLTTLSTHDGETLIRFARHLYPHDTLEDAVYALVAKDLDTASQSDAATAKLLNEGVLELDAAAGGSWLELPADRRLELVRARESTPFFEKVRSTAVVTVYDNDMAFAHFGYEGPAFSRGGYLGRGFDDLDWLPDPAAAASPPI